MQDLPRLNFDLQDLARLKINMDISELSSSE